MVRIRSGSAADAPENARARRFYERSGFRLQGRTHELYQLGGITEVCYERDIDPR